MAKKGTKIESEFMKKQKILEKTKEIDIDATLKGLEYNKCLFFFTLSDVNISKLDTDFKSVPKILRTSTPLFTLRLALYHIFIASC